MNTTWCGRNVTIQEGRSDGKHDFGDEFPWIFTSKNGLEVAVPSWSMDDGEYDFMCAGVSLNDLITGLIKTESVLDFADATETRLQAIEALRSAIHRLESEPLMTPNVQIGGLAGTSPERSEKS